jgi:GNAT superfamily N-acetyltransferase
VAVRIRPLTAADLTTAERVTAHAFYDLDVRTHRPGWPEPELRPAARTGPWIERLGHMVEHDGPGCWVAEDEDGRIVGVVAAIVREGLWGLSTFAVLSEAQGKGVGRALLEAALDHGDRSSPGIICSSEDQKAIRRYRQAGFDIYPAMLMWGPVDRSALPAISDVREGSPGDVELLDAIDRQVRGAGRGPDHPLLIKQQSLLVIDNGSRRGYVYHRDGGHVYQLSASDPETAQQLLWQVLAGTPAGQPAELHNLNAEQAWALDVGLAAGMELHVYGYLPLRNMAAPSPYIPSGHFL